MGVVPWQWTVGAAGHMGRCPPTTQGSPPMDPVLRSSPEALMLVAGVPDSAAPVDVIGITFGSPLVDGNGPSHFQVLFNGVTMRKYGSMGFYIFNHLQFSGLD